MRTTAPDQLPLEDKLREKSCPIFGAGVRAARTVVAAGTLTLHGVSHRTTVMGTLQLRNGQLAVLAYFSVAPANCTPDGRC